LFNYLTGELIILLLLGHNFWTRNPSKSSKVSKDRFLPSFR